MKFESFVIFADFLKRASGLVLRPDQEYLLQARLSSLLELYACTDLDDLARRLKNDPPPSLPSLIRDAMATHETFFFRDPAIFETLRTTILPELEKHRSTRPLRFWSAGCATGQEPYSLAMLLDQENIPSSTIIGTDISQNVLNHAARGIYSHYEAQRGLPVRYLLQYFSQHGHDWHLADAIKQRITFQTLNLLDDFSSLGVFDVIFCRNVLFYVDSETKNRILRRLHDTLAPHGFLILGTVETAADRTMWQSFGTTPGIFRKV